MAVAATDAGAVTARSGDPGLPLSNIAIEGAAAGQRSGTVVAAAGDVNGDGLNDMLVTAPQGNSGDYAKGITYVVYGTRSPDDIFLATFGSHGFRIVGAASGSFAGRAAAAAGDVNHDGYDDVIVGADAASNAGASYVVFGKANPTDVYLASLTANQGFSITGAAASAYSGSAVGGAGDVNGDHYDDVVVGAWGTSSAAGATYVIFGKASPTNVNLSSLGAGGISITGAAASDASGSSVAGAGDVNGDGYDDILIGAYNATSAAGKAYVVYGASSPSSVSLGSLGARGFTIAGADPVAKWTGYAVAGAGDVNGDGRADVIIGAPQAQPAFFSTTCWGATVVYGSTTPPPSPVAVASLSSAQGFRVSCWSGSGGSGTVNTGYSVAGAGDVNGDGYGDVLTGAPDASSSLGRSYVIYGSAAPGDIADLAALGSGGFPINGVTSGGKSGYSVGGLGDVNGDGHPDMITGAPFTTVDPNVFPLTDAGASWVLFGFARSTVSYGNGVAGTVGTPLSVSPTIVSTGTTSFSVSPALPPGLQMNATTGVISGTPTGATTTSHVVTMSDLGGQATSSVPVTIAATGTGGGGGSTPSDPATPPATPTNITWRGGSTPGATLVATFRATRGVSYGVSATTVAAGTDGKARGTARSAESRRGRCTVSAGGSSTGPRATCRIRLTRAGTWVVSITPRAHGVSGVPARKRVVVRPGRPVPLPVVG